MSDEMVKIGDTEPKLTIEQSLGRYVENSELSDVCFLVGEEREMIYAHRLLLSIESEVFKAMFYGELKETSYDIEVPDLTPAGFRNMMRYFYTKKVEEIYLSEIYETYMAANKYIASAFIRDLIDHIRSRLDVSNVCVIYEQLLKLKIDNSLFAEVKHLMATKFSKVCASDSFTEIEKDTLISLLKLNRLNVYELKLLEVCIRWTNSEVERQGSHLDDIAKKRTIFEAFKPLIRFGDLELESFGSIAGIHHYLTAEEISSILLHRFQSCIPIQIDYRSPRRSSKIQAINENRYNIFNLSSMSDIGLKFSIEVNKACFISAIQTFPVHEFELLRIEVQISNVEGLKVNQTFNPPAEFPTPLGVQLNHLLEPGVKCEIRFMFTILPNYHVIHKYKLIYSGNDQEILKSDESEAVFSVRKEESEHIPCSPKNIIQKIEFIGPFE